MDRMGVIYSFELFLSEVPNSYLSGPTVLGEKLTGT